MSRDRRTTASLDANDPDVVAVKARAAVARGRYEQAEAMLPRSCRSRRLAPPLLNWGCSCRCSAADARPVLERVALLAGRSPDPVDIARGARARRALGLLRDARFVMPARLEPCTRRSTINTGWGELFLETEQHGEALKSFQAALKADAR